MHVIALPAVHNRADDRARDGRPDDILEHFRDAKDGRDRLGHIVPDHDKAHQHQAKQRAETEPFDDSASVRVQASVIEAAMKNPTSCTA